MAKKMKKTQEKKTVWHSTFSSINNAKHSGWSIVYNKSTDRIELKDGEQTLFSSISILNCKNIAEQRYSITFDTWSK